MTYGSKRSILRLFAFSPAVSTARSRRCLAATCLQSRAGPKVPHRNPNCEQASLGMSSTTMESVVSETVKHEHEGTQLSSLLVQLRSGSTSSSPVVLIAHTAIGLEDPFIVNKAEELARLGYVAFAADLTGVTSSEPNPEAHRKVTRQLMADRPRLQSRMLSCVDALMQWGSPHKVCSRIAAIGYCFGGAAVLDLARAAPPQLKCVVSFHGILDAPTLPRDKKPITAKVLVCHGDADPFIPAQKERDFRNDMRERGADWRMIVYGGVKHAFTRPEKTTESDNAAGLLYDETAAENSWREATALFRSTLREA